MKNNEHGKSFSLRSAARFSLKHFMLSILATMVLSGCGSGGGGGSGSGGAGGTSADTSMVISPSSALLTNSGQTQQLRAVVYKADGTVDSAAQVTWTVVDPTAASVIASGNAATVTAVANPGFTQVVATSGALTANASVAIAMPAAQTHVLDPSLIVSVSPTQTQLVLVQTPATTAIQPSDDVVSRGVLVKVLTVQANGTQLTLTTTPATLSEAFTSFVFTAQGQPPRQYTAAVSAVGVKVIQQASASPLIPWDQVKCTLGGQAVATPTLTGGGFTFSGLIPTPSFKASQTSFLSGVTITGSVSATPDVSVATPTLTLSPSLQGILDCQVPLPTAQIPAASFWGIVSADFDATPVIGFSIDLTLSGGLVSFTGPQFTASTKYQAGFNWPLDSLPSGFDTVTPPTETFTPFKFNTQSPSLTAGFKPYAKVAIGMNLQTLIYNAAGIDFADPEIDINATLGISSLADSYKTNLTAYQGPSWSANLDGKVDFPIQVTGGLQSALNTIGFHNTSFNLATINLFTVPLAGSPTFALATASTTATTGGAPVALTVAQAGTGLFPENDAGDMVQFWETGSSGSPTMLDTTTLSSGGTASYNWTCTASQAGNDSITAMVFGLLGGIDLPYASTSVDVTVSATSTGNSTISASPPSIPADGATVSAVTVQLYDTNGQKITVGGATVLIASTLGTVSSVTDNNNGTYTAQLASTAVGTAVLSFTVNGVASTNTASVSVTSLTSNITVSATTPASGANGVSISSAVSATFNGAIDASTLNTSTFTLTSPGGSVTATVTYNAATNTATFTPSAALAYSTTYIATISAGVKDPAGNPLASNYSWSFTTAGTVAGVAPRFAYVANAGDNSVSVYAVNAATGRLVFTGKVAAGTSPQSVTVDPGGNYAYVANYNSDTNSTVSQYTIGNDGSLTPMATPTVAAGVGPYSVTVDPSGKYAYVANVGGTTVSQYTIGSDGSLTPMATPTVAAGSAPICVTVGPNGMYAYVVNSSGTVSQYMIGADGNLILMATPTVAAGTSPQSITVDPSGKYAYVANYGGANVSQYTVGSNGGLTPMGTPTVAAGVGPYSVTVDPSGKYAYVANDGSANVSQYTIGSDGSLTPMTTGSVAAGTEPRSVTVDPSGKYVYVANDGDNTVSQYMIGADGSLTPNAPATIAAQPGPSSLAMSHGASPVAAVPEYAYVANLSSNNVSQYKIGSDGSLALMATPTVAAGTAPGLVTVDPSGKYAYATNQNSANISQYTIGSDGSLTPMATPTVAAGTTPLSITVDPSGKYAYVANDGDANVSQYTIGTDGSLTAMSIPTVAAGTSPQSITVDPSGKYAYVANNQSGNVSQYTIGSDGSLTPMSTSTVAAGLNPWAITVDPSGKYAYVANQHSANVSQYTIGSDGSLTPMATPTVAAGSAPDSVVIIGSYQ